MSATRNQVVLTAGRGWSFSGQKGRPRQRGLAYASLLLPLLFLAVLGVVPLIQLVRMSVSSVGPQNIVGDWPLAGVDNYVTLFESTDFWHAFGITFLFTAVLLGGVLVLGFIAALWLARDTALCRFVQGLMMLCWALPPIVTGTGWKFLLQGTGPVNGLLEWLGLSGVPWLGSASLALWSLIGVTVWANIPFGATVMRAGLLSVPREIVEAAALDGAGTVTTIFRVVLPQLRGLITTLSVLVFVYGFGSSFNFIYVVTAGGPGTSTQTLPFFGYQSAFQNFQFGTAGAIAVVSMVVVVLFASGYIRSAGREAAAR